VDTYWQTETGAHLATNLPGRVDCVVAYDDIYVDFTMIIYK